MTIVLFMVTIFLTVLSGGIWLFSLRKRTRRNKRRTKRPRVRDRQKIVDRANSILSRSPKSKRGLQMLAGLYLAEEAWDKALKMLGLLVDMTPVDSTDEQVLENYLNYGICHYKTGQHVKAHQIFSTLRGLNVEHPDLDYTLGCLEYDRERYTEAIPLLRRVLAVQPRNLEAQLRLAHSYYQMRQSSEALQLFQGILHVRKDNPEVLTMVGRLLLEVGQLERAVPIFDRLCHNPDYAAKALLLRGMARIRMQSLEPALADLNAALKSTAIDAETHIESLYQIALIYIARKDVEALMPALRNIARVRPNYRDVESLITSYSELHQNSVLRTYLVGRSNRFIELCRQLAVEFFSDSTVSLHDVSMVIGNHCDILSEVRTLSWHDTVMFRFVRSGGLVGELVVRDMHEKLRETRAARGVCFTAGIFSRDANIFIEPRAILAVEKNRLLELFKRIQPAEA